MSGGVHRGTREGRALGFSAANTTLSKLAGLVVGIALARLLGPSEFGTYAVAFVALMVVLSLNDLGVSLAIVRWPDDPRRIAPTVASLSVLSSAMLALGLAAAAGPSRA
ncbi:oligosaccharide flippase family protein [Nocardioides zeae]